jgi:hypothetical protein
MCNCTHVPDKTREIKTDSHKKYRESIERSVMVIQIQEKRSARRLGLSKAGGNIFPHDLSIIDYSFKKNSSIILNHNMAS